MSRLKYVHTPSKKPLNYTTINVLIEKLAKEKPDQEQYIHRLKDGSRKALTNKEVFSKAKIVAKHLVTLGINKGDMIGILGPNALQWIISEFGILLCGGIAVHLSGSTRNTVDILEIIQAAKYRGFFVDVRQNQYSVNLVNTLTSATMKCSFKIDKMDKSHVILINDTNLLEMEKYSTVESIIANDKGTDISLPEVYPEDIAIVFTTSGSTGKPKMVAQRHCSLTMDEPYITSSTHHYNIMLNDRPFSWSGGTLVDFYCVNCPRVFMDSSISQDNNNSKFIWDLICEEKCDIAKLAPYCIRDMLSKFKQKELVNYKVGTIVTSGQIIPNSFIETIGALCEDLQIRYGSTEDWLVSIRHIKSQDEIFMTGDVGFPTAGAEVVIVDEWGNPTPLETVGSILVKTPMMFKKYVNDPDATNEAFAPNGWYRTGDLGKLIDDGRLIIMGRQKDVINRGTRKIFPGLIEDVVQNMTNIIKRVAVIAVSDQRLFEEVCVCFVAEEGLVGSDEAVRLFCQEQFIAKCDAIDGIGTMPKYFLEFKKLPFLSSGKIDKLLLRGEAERRLSLPVPNLSTEH